MKILTKLTLAFLLVSLLPLTGTSIFSYWNTRKALTQKVLNQLDSVATLQEHRLEELINQNLEKLSLVSSRTQLRRNLESLIDNSKQSPSSQQPIQDEMSQMLLDSKSSINSFREISLLTLDGRVVASTDTSSVGTNHLSEEFFIKGKKENSISDFFFDRNQNVRVHLSGPIYSGKRLLGVTLVELDPDSLTSLVKDYSGLGETGETTLAQRTKSGDGITISPLRFNPHATLRVAVPKSNLKRPMTQALLKRELLLPNSVNYRGRPVLAVSRYIPRVDWGLTVIIDRSEAFAPIYNLRNSLLLTIFTSSSGVVLISFYVARSATRPVISLTQVASKISLGDLSQRVSITSKDETGILAQTFNQMTERLLKARTGLEQQVEARTAQLQEEIRERAKIEQELRESKLFAERITEQSTSIIYVLDLDTMTNVYSNRNVAQLIGYSLEQTQSMGKDFLHNVIHPDDLLDRLYRFEMLKHARDDEVIEFEQRVKHASGGWRWIWSREVVFKRRPNGTPCQIIGTAQDITERKQTEVALQQARDQLEKRVAERTAELQTAIMTLSIEIAERKQAENEIRLLQEIGQAVSESLDFDAALEVTLRKVCEATGWSYVESWIPSSDDTALKYGPVWYSSEDTLEQFSQFSETFTFAPGMGLPGRVWSSRQPEWIRDVSAQPESIFLRADIAITTGLKAALGIPVTANDQVVAVLVFFMFESHEEDERLVSVISTIATQLGSDIQRKQTEAALQESEGRYRTLITSSVQIIWTNSAEGKMVGEQPGWAAFTGQTYEQYQDYGWSEAIHAGDREHTLQEWYKSVERRGLFEVQHRVRRYDGEYRHFAVRAVPVLESNGSIREWVGTHTDITEAKHFEAGRKQAETKLKESEERYRILTEVSPQIIWMALPDSSIIYSNQQWFNYTGLTMEQTAADGWSSVIHPEDREQVLEAWKYAVAQDMDYELEIRFRQASDGTYRWHLARGLPLQDASGQTVKWFGIAIDIHERKLAEAALYCARDELEDRIAERTKELANTSQRLQAILDNIGDGVIVINKQGEFLLFNPAAGNILGIGSTTESPDKWSQEYGLYLPDMVTPYPNEDLPLALAIRGIVADEIEVFSRTQQKPTGVWLSASARPLKGPSGEITGGIAVFHDITERKRAEENLRGYAAKLEKANQELEQFNYVAAHDLKTPLRTINTRVELLAKQFKPLNQTAQHQLSRISLAAQRMDCLLDDLVAYSQIGNRVNSLAPTNSQVIVKQVIQQLKEPIQESEATIEVEETLPAVLADATQFAQVWQQLISNSLKFCHMTPHIKIFATCSSEKCTFCVEDNGIGIPAASGQRIFGVFKRLHSQEIYEGTGIGLAVVKRILDWHGGRIWVESEAGKGSKFFFTLRKPDSRKE